jgi:hypothetical protein
VGIICEQFRCDRRETSDGRSKTVGKFTKVTESAPIYCGENARESALSYAKQRAGYAPTEIQVLDAEWNVAEIIAPQITRGLV